MKYKIKIQKKNQIESSEIMVKKLKEKDETIEIEKIISRRLLKEKDEMRKIEIDGFDILKKKKVIYLLD